MALLPKVKLKALVSFPATVGGGAGIEVTKTNGNYSINLDYGDFGIVATPPPNSLVLSWNSATQSYVLAPAASGGLPDAPADGTLYGRQNTAWVAVPVSMADAPNDGTLYGRKNLAWVAVPASLPDAPNDGSLYGRKSLGWALVPASIPDAPNDGSYYARRNLAWAVVPAVSPATVAPLMDGVAAVGLSLLYARQDHVHPTDTSRAAVSALPAPATVAPVMDSVATVGTSLLYARQDHIHPSDTTRLTDAPSDGYPYVRSNAAWIRRRIKLLAATTFYVRNDGNDANNGSANNAANAFLTLQGCYNYLASTLDFGGQNVLIQIGLAGTYTGALNITQPWGGGGNVTLDGGGNVIAVASGTAVIVNATLPGSLTVQNARFIPTGPANHIGHGGYGRLTLGAGVEFGNAQGGDHIEAIGAGAYVYVTGGYTVSGSHRFNLYAALGGTINMYTGVAQTVNVTASYTMGSGGAWAYTETGGRIQAIWNFITYTLGANVVTGQKYSSNTNGLILTQGGGVNFFPGTVAGVGTNSGVAPYGFYG
jgi:hypothetical protein